MPQPQASPRRRLTPQDALLAAQAAAAARTPDQLVTVTTMRAAEGVIAAREKAARWAKLLIGKLWHRVDPYDGRAVAEFTAAATQHMAVAQKSAATYAAAGQKQILTTMGVKVTPRPSNPIDVRAPEVDFVDGHAQLRRDNVTVTYGDNVNAGNVSVDDMSTEGIFNRPARTYRYQRAQGVTHEQAAHAADVRLDGLVDGNVMLAQRLAEFEVVNLAAEQSNSKIVGTRRVIHPELSRSGVCGLCAAASDRLYTVRELLPIHDHCKCTTAPVHEDFDPADYVNAIDLAQLYKDSGGTSREYLKRTRYKEDEHGELAVVLKPERAYKPRGKKTRDDKPRDDKSREQSSPDKLLGELETKAEIAARHLPHLEDNLDKLHVAGLTDDSSQVKWHKQQIKRFRADLADEKTAPPAPTKAAPGPAESLRVEQKVPALAAAGGGDGTGGRGGDGPGGDGPGGSGGGGTGERDEDPHQRLDRLFAEQSARATSQQRAAVKRWQGPDRFYDRVQEALGGADDDEAQTVAQEIVKLAQPLPEDTELWRGIRSISETFGVHATDVESLTGREWRESRFMSTTISRAKTTPEFTHPGSASAILQIVARSGARAVWIPPLGVPNFVRQSELLFVDGTRVRILGVDVSGDLPLIRVEVT